MTYSINAFAKRAVSTLAMMALFSLSVAYADAGSGPCAHAVGLGALACNVKSSIADFGSLMISIAYLAGIGFGIAAVFKFKQHKDNPQQTPVGTPFAMLGISVVLVFLPGIYAPAGQTLFGKGGAGKEQVGGFGGDISGLPGAGSSGSGGSGN